MGHRIGDGVGGSPMPLGELCPYLEAVPRSGAALLLEANVGKPLLDVLRDMMLDPDEQAAFADDRSAYLAQYGYDDVDTEHLNEAFSLVADTLPPDVAQTVAAAAPATAAPVDQDDGSGGAPDTTINPDEDAFGGVDEGFDTMALNGSADDGASDLDTDDAGETGDLDDAGALDGIGADGNGNGGYGTGELSLGDVADGGLDADDLGAGDTVAFGVGSEGAGGAGGGAEALADDLPGDGAPVLDSDAEAFALDDLDDADAGLADDGFDDTPDLDDGGLDLGPSGADGAPPDDVDDGPADDPSFDDIGSF